ncbi:hypothetical protein L2E82_40835 [Cichorium intybus]|uniref:Uncharacterized protein n=1 Tax=Cichorium intybus TaxID=13427 RepID=A0ACB9ALI7_CICIN|nr:hypothetical protein L2E82_40835 [Cichorium intybus]
MLKIRTDYIEILQILRILRTTRPPGLCFTDLRPGVFLRGKPSNVWFNPVDRLVNNVGRRRSYHESLVLNFWSIHLWLSGFFSQLKLGFPGLDNEPVLKGCFTSLLVQISFITEIKKQLWVRKF